jgi:hypothetical protein
MATTTNFGWETPDDTDLVKDGALAMRTLGNGIDTSFVDLKGGTTGQVLSKTSNTDLDFTWVTSDDANAIQNAIVDAKGDLIAASANDTPARLAVGNNGETIVADSSASTGLRYVKTSPNYAVNGAFDFWQRGTSFTVTNANGYTADRFYCYAAGANATAARSTTTPTASIAPYSLEFTGAASQTALEIGQRIESQYMNALKTTVTFSAKVYNNTGAAFTPTIYIQTPTAVDNWAGLTNVVNNVSLQSCADGAWTTIYYTADWSGYSNISNGAAIIVEFGSAANANTKKIRITEWQVTPTPIIMPFQRSSATLAGELDACLRYFWAYNVSDTNTQGFNAGLAISTTRAIFPVRYPKPMRTKPSLAASANSNFVIIYGGYSTATATSISMNNGGPQAFELDVSVASGLTSGNAAMIGTTGNASAYLWLSAEL